MIHLLEKILIFFFSSSLTDRVQQFLIFFCLSKINIQKKKILLEEKKHFFSHPCISDSMSIYFLSEVYCKEIQISFLFFLPKSLSSFPFFSFSILEIKRPSLSPFSHRNIRENKRDRIESPYLVASDFESLRGIYPAE